MNKIQNSIKLMAVAFAFCAAMPMGSNAEEKKCDICVTAFAECMGACTVPGTCGCDAVFLKCTKDCIAAKKKSKK